MRDPSPKELPSLMQSKKEILSRTRSTHDTKNKTEDEGMSPDSQKFKEEESPAPRNSVLKPVRLDFANEISFAESPTNEADDFFNSF